MLQLDLYRGTSGRHIALRVRDGGGVGWGPVENCETATGGTALPCMVARWLRLHSAQILAWPYHLLLSPCGPFATLGSYVRL